MTHKEIEEMVENAIATQGVIALLTAIVNVCYDKSAHIEINWQDKAAARRWSAAAKRIEKALRYDYPL